MTGQRLDLDDAALLTIDMQRHFVFPDGGGDDSGDGGGRARGRSARLGVPWRWPSGRQT